MSINFNHVTNDISASSGSVTINGSVPGSGGGSSTLTISNKTAAYTVVAGDNGTIINCTSGTFTVALTAAATLGSGFNCWVWNTSNTATDVVTIDPNGTETLDGRTTLVLQRGEGMQIVCDGSNWQTGDKKRMRAYAENMPASYPYPVASATGALAIGGVTQATGDASLALGLGAQASQSYASSIGANSAGSGPRSSGIGSMALGGSYASGTDSFAAAIANNTSTYGAQGTNSVAIGYQAKATAIGSVAISANRFANAQSTAAGAVAIGDGAIASGSLSAAIGRSVTASAGNSVAVGTSATSDIIGKYVFSSGQFAASGDSQTGTFVLRRATTDATATVITSDNTAAGATNQVILPNNSAYAFRCLVVGRRSVAQADEARAYEFSGLIRRGANAASTTLVAAITPTLIAGDATTATWGGVSVTADTTNGGLSITVTGEAAKNIRWVATVWTSEVTYA